MNKLLKYLLYTVLTVSILFILVVGALITYVTATFDPNEFKPEIAEAVAEKTGRKLDIKGDLSLTFFPWLGFSMGEATLSNAAGFSAENMVSIKQSSVKIKILPLLANNIVVDVIVFDGLTVNLEKNAKGVTNWDDLVEAAKQAEAEAEQDKQQDTGTSQDDGQFTMPDFTIGGLAVTNTNLFWKDGTTGQKYELRDFNLNIGSLDPVNPTDIRIKGTLLGTEPTLDVTVEMQTTAKLDVAQKRILLTNFSQKETISNLRVGENFLSGVVSTLIADGILDWDDGFVRLSGLRLDHDLKGGMLPGGKNKGYLATELDLNWLKQAVSLAGLELGTGGMILKGDITATDYTKNLAAKADIHTNEFSLRTLMASLGMEAPATKDPTVLEKVSIASNIAATRNSLDVTDLHLTLDQTSATGKASVKNFAKPAIAFTLEADNIIVDRYIPEGGDKKEEQPIKEEPTQDEQKSDDPYKALRELDLDGTVRLAQLSAYNVLVKDIVVKVLAKDGKLRIDPFGANLYGGKIDLRTLSDFTKASPISSAKLGLSGLDLAGLLKDATGTDLAGGKTIANIDVKGIGTDIQEVLKSLDGSASLKVTEGFIRGFRLEPSRFDAKKGYTGDTNDADALTQFKDFVVNYSIRDGVAKTDNIALHTNLSSATGTGSMNLATQELNYDIDADLGVMTVPVSIGGSFTSPKVNVNMERALTNTINKVIETPEGLGKGLINAITGQGKNSGSTSSDSKKSSGTGNPADLINNLFGGGKK